MIATLVLFNNPELANNDQELRERMFGRGDLYAAIPGLRSKVWVRSPETNRFGAFLVWNTREDLERYSAGSVSNSLSEVWGVVPEISQFEVLQILEADGSLVRPESENQEIPGVTRV